MQRKMVEEAPFMRYFLSVYINMITLSILADKNIGWLMDWN